MMPSIDVSVIVAAWKAADTVERAVASALRSDGVSIEVVAVDDASPDSTADVLRRLAADAPRVVVERLDVNSGPSVARNRAIILARGRYIAVLDADDTVAPDRLAALVAIADRTGADIVADNMIEMDAAGERINDKAFLKGDKFTVAHDIGLAEWVKFNQPLKAGDCLGYLKPLFRRSMLDEPNASYDPRLRNSEDYYLVAHLLAAGARMTYTPMAGYRYTRSAGSTSHRLASAQTKALLEAEDRFQARFAAMLEVDERSALAARKRGLRGLHQLVCAVDELKARRPGKVMRLLASDLQASGFTVSTLAKIAMGKALRRKMV